MQVNPGGGETFFVCHIMAFHFFQEYNKALNFIGILLSVEPANRQARELERLIKKRVEKGNCRFVCKLYVISCILWSG